ncbi:hypothetical protein LTS10_012282 [Elasticomyces elasticus]|nr:hypothetical protein LTS10_012282 [Elasticomyces elasticus]
MAKPTKTRKERKRKAEEDEHDSSEDHRTLPPPAKKRKQVLDNPDKEIKLKENIIDKAEEEEEVANAERIDCEEIKLEENVVDEAEEEEEEEEEEEAVNAERVNYKGCGATADNDGQHWMACGRCGRREHSACYGLTQLQARVRRVFSSRRVRGGFEERDLGADTLAVGPVEGVRKETWVLVHRDKAAEHQQRGSHKCSYGGKKHVWGSAEYSYAGIGGSIGCVGHRPVVVTSALGQSRGDVGLSYAASGTTLGMRWVEEGYSYAGIGRGLGCVCVALHRDSF